MIEALLPRRHRRYSALPLVGTVVADFIRWRSGQGLRRWTLLQYLSALVRIDRCLRRRGILRLDEIALDDLRRCWQATRGCRRAYLRAAANAFATFLTERSLMKPSAPRARSATVTLVAEYGNHLREMRGLSELTIQKHMVAASNLLDQLEYERHPTRLPMALTPRTIETFVRATGQRVSRQTLQQIIARIRGFLRFLVFRGMIPAGLEPQIDTPRCYRLARLPRSLSWETVRALLDGIDRTRPPGLRDYTMLFLMATYGLRACEIVALTLDSIAWRPRVLHVPSRKRAPARVLPLTDAAATVLIDYLRRARPHQDTHRELFLRATGPWGGLKPAAVTQVFQRHVERTGLPIAFHGPHCLRHSYAIHLLRQGTSLKVIGDLLGHRTPASTCVYLRLAVTDLRTVALSLPPAERQGVRS